MQIWQRISAVFLNDDVTEVTFNFLSHDKSRPPPHTNISEGTLFTTKLKDKQHQSHKCTRCHLMHSQNLWSPPAQISCYVDLTSRVQHCHNKWPPQHSYSNVLYPTTNVCHSSPLFRRTCGQPDEWGLLHTTAEPTESDNRQLSDKIMNPHTFHVI